MRIHASMATVMYFVASAQSDIIYVDKDSSVGGDGSSWAQAFSELEDALVAATSGDELWIAEGTYFPDLSPPRNPSGVCPPCTGGNDTQYDCGKARTFLIPDGVSLYGGFLGTESARSDRSGDPSLTILTGSQGIESIAQVMVTEVGSNSNITIDSVTVQDGSGLIIDQTFLVPVSAFSVGGGLFNRGDNVDIVNCVFRNNNAKLTGGAIHSQNGLLTLTDCSFKNNYADGTEGDLCP